MSYSNENTILVYATNQQITETVESFAKSKSLLVYHSDAESDLIAVPNLFIVTDINKLSKSVFSYIDGMISDEIIDEQIFISSSEPESEIALEYARYFELKSGLCDQDLKEAYNKRNVR